MIKNLTLTNFRQHRNLSLDLTSGLIVIRGANEAGKSTIMEAIEYAFYGARALRETIDETVTWGEPATTLRVVMTFEFDGVQGTVSRSKSGAEVLYGGNLSSGQNEVTKFFENLFRTNANMASNLQIASQTKVRGAVEGGGSNAVALIESLADFSLLETVVDRIQQQKPYGSTNLLSDRISRLEAAAKLEPVAPSQDAAVAAESKAKVLEQDAALMSAGLTAAEPAVAAARAYLARAEAAQRAEKRASDRLAAVRADLGSLTPVAPPSAAQVAEWRAGLAAQKQQSVAIRHYNTALPKSANGWSGTREEFDASYQKAKADLLHTQREIAALETSRKVAVTQLIKDKTCALCQKDLSDVPEVVAINAKLDSKIAAIDEELALARIRLGNRESDVAAYTELKYVDDTIERTFNTEFWKHDLTTYPRKVGWVGPTIFEGAQPDFDKLIADAEAAQRAYDKVVGAKAVLEAEEVRLLEELAGMEEFFPDKVDNCKTTLENYDTHCANAKAKQAEFDTAMQEARLLRMAYVGKQELYQTQVKQQAEAKAQLEDAKAELDATGFHNELVRKIRAARPAVANKLWASVLAAVSHYTTIGRGQPSTVTRDKGGFRINGKAVAAYSGSAQDVLGMAVRLALIKTFLPNTPFMVMDEIAAACDDSRELDMLGMVIAADIPQVLLVTHSSMAESFANQLVQL